MTDILERRPLPGPKPPRVPEPRSVDGRLTRINGYVMMSFAAAISSGGPPNPTRSLPFIAMARAACRVPDPCPVGPALERIDELLSAAELMLSADGYEPRTALGHVMSAGVIAATEPLTTQEERVNV